MAASNGTLIDALQQQMADMQTLLANLSVIVNNHTNTLSDHDGRIDSLERTQPSFELSGSTLNITQEVG